MWLMSRFLLTMAAVAAMLGASRAQADDKPPASVEGPLPSPNVTLSVQTPSASGRWVMLITNADDAPMRIHADARLLRLLVAPRGKNYFECELPALMRSGDTRDLLLKPGESYREEFDPRLVCFGKVIDEIGEGTSVTAFWGYKPDAQRQKTHKPQLAPFVVEPTEGPATFTVEKRLVSLTTWLPAEPKKTEGDSAKPEEPVPINAPRLVIDPVRRVDATALRDARVSATVKNVGDRSALIHIRTDQLEFQVTGPAGRGTCGGRERRRAPVRDFFHTIQTKGSETLTVLLAEACPREVFKRPGLYEISTVLHAPSDGGQFGLHAVTGDFNAVHRTLLRLQQAKEPYHAAPARAEPKN